ncbi:CHAT domain-containing protein [Streptomyces sp. NPDC001404]|uniref:CHAT domain-containing protein n=1 Tax=Streptomyces sp. NPDC001404 TaxID=3364571 RepID=UPI00368B441C
MDGTTQLLPEDRAAFERVLDEALRIVPTPNAEAVRVSALAAQDAIAARAGAEYRHYREAADAAAARPATSPRAAGRSRLAVIGVALLAIAGIVAVVLVEARWDVWTGLSLAVGLLGLRLGLGRFAQVRRRGTASADGDPSGEVAATREAWIAALLRLGVLPFIAGELARPPDGALLWRPAPGVRMPEGSFHGAPEQPPAPQQPDDAGVLDAPDVLEESEPTLRLRPYGDEGVPAADYGPVFGCSERRPGRERRAITRYTSSSCSSRTVSSRPQPEPAPAPHDPRRLTVELAEQASPGRDVPLHVQVTCDLAAIPGASPGVPLRPFALPPDGARLLITVHAPELLALGDLQQELLVPPGRDSDVLRFGLRTTRTGLHTVTVRAFHGGTFLGEARTQISVEDGTPTRDGPARDVALPTVAFDPGEVTLQVLKATDGSYSFQLLSERCYAPESFRLLGGDSRGPTERIYDELRKMATAAGKAGPEEGEAARRRLRNLGVQLWSAAVPDAVRRQFWAEAGRVSSFTVLGEHDLVPWELLYPLDGPDEGDGFLAEWMPVVRRVFGQERVRELQLPRATYVVPPGSPADAAREVEKIRRALGSRVVDGGVLAERAALADLIDDGLPGLLHFACHNAFTGAGSSVKMSDGTLDPIDLAYATQSGALRRTHPLVFFNACRSAGQIDWFSSSLGWAPQFLRAGAGAFVGSLWPVRSDSALAFADFFYGSLVHLRATLGEASLMARRAVRDHAGGDPTWLAYAVYGSPAARVHNS